MPVNDGSNIRITPFTPMEMPNMAKEMSSLFTAMRRASGGGGGLGGQILFNPVTGQFERIPGGSPKERQLNMNAMNDMRVQAAWNDSKNDNAKAIQKKLQDFENASVERKNQIIDDIRRNDIPKLAKDSGIDGRAFIAGPLKELEQRQQEAAQQVAKTGAMDVLWDSARIGLRNFTDSLADLGSNAQEQAARANARQQYIEQVRNENAYLQNSARRQAEGADFMDRFSGREVLAAAGEFAGQNIPTFGAMALGTAIGGPIGAAAGLGARAGSIVGAAIPGAVTGAGQQMTASVDAILSDTTKTTEQKMQELEDAQTSSRLFGGALGAVVMPVGQGLRRAVSSGLANRGIGGSQVAQTIRNQRAGKALPNEVTSWDEALTNARRADIEAENALIQGRSLARFRQQAADSMLEGGLFGAVGQLGTNVIANDPIGTNMGAATLGGLVGGLGFTPFNRRTLRDVPDAVYNPQVPVNPAIASHFGPVVNNSGSARLNDMLRNARWTQRQDAFLHPPVSVPPTPGEFGFDAPNNRSYYVRNAGASPNDIDWFLSGANADFSGTPVIQSHVPVQQVASQAAQQQVQQVSPQAVQQQAAAPSAADVSHLDSLAAGEHAKLTFSTPAVGDAYQSIANHIRKINSLGKEARNNGYINNKLAQKTNSIIDKLSPDELRNLADHMNVYLQYEAHRSASNRVLQPTALLYKAKDAHTRQVMDYIQSRLNTLAQPQPSEAQQQFIKQNSSLNPPKAPDNQTPASVSTGRLPESEAGEQGLNLMGPNAFVPKQASAQQPAVSTQQVRQQPVGDVPRPKAVPADKAVTNVINNILKKWGKGRGKMSTAHKNSIDKAVDALTLEQKQILVNTIDQRNGPRNMSSSAHTQNAIRYAYDRAKSSTAQEGAPNAQQQATKQNSVQGAGAEPAAKSQQQAAASTTAAINAITGSGGKQTTARLEQSVNTGAPAVDRGNPDGNSGRTPTDERTAATDANNISQGALVVRQATEERGNAGTEAHESGEAPKTEGVAEPKVAEQQAADGKRSAEPAAPVDAKTGEGAGGTGLEGGTGPRNGRDAADAGSHKQSGDESGDGDGAIEDREHTDDWVWNDPEEEAAAREEIHVNEKTGEIGFSPNRLHDGYDEWNTYGVRDLFVPKREKTDPDDDSSPTSYVTFKNANGDTYELSFDFYRKQGSIPAHWSESSEDTPGVRIDNNKNLIWVNLKQAPEALQRAASGFEARVEIVLKNDENSEIADSAFPLLPEEYPIKNTAEARPAEPAPEAPVTPEQADRQRVAASSFNVKVSPDGGITSSRNGWRFNDGAITNRVRKNVTFDPATGISYNVKRVANNDRNFTPGRTLYPTGVRRRQAPAISVHISNADGAAFNITFHNADAKKYSPNWVPSIQDTGITVDKDMFLHIDPNTTNPELRRAMSGDGSLVSVVVTDAAGKPITSNGQIGRQVFPLLPNEWAIKPTVQETLQAKSARDTAVAAAKDAKDTATSQKLVAPKADGQDPADAKVLEDLAKITKADAQTPVETPAQEAKKTPPRRTTRKKTEKKAEEKAAEEQSTGKKQEKTTVTRRRVVVDAPAEKPTEQPAEKTAEQTPDTPREEAVAQAKANVESKIDARTESYDYGQEDGTGVISSRLRDLQEEQIDTMADRILKLQKKGSKAIERNPVSTDEAPALVMSYIIDLPANKLGTIIRDAGVRDLKPFRAKDSKALDPMKVADAMTYALIAKNVADEAADVGFKLDMSETDNALMYLAYKSDLPAVEMSAEERTMLNVWLGDKTIPRREKTTRAAINMLMTTPDEARKRILNDAQQGKCSMPERKS